MPSLEQHMEACHHWTRATCRATSCNLLRRHQQVGTHNRCGQWHHLLRLRSGDGATSKCILACISNEMRQQDMLTFRMGTGRGWPRRLHRSRHHRCRGCRFRNAMTGMVGHGHVGPQMTRDGFETLRRIAVRHECHKAGASQGVIAPRCERPKA